MNPLTWRALLREGVSITLFIAGWLGLVGALLGSGGFLVYRAAFDITSIADVERSLLLGLVGGAVFGLAGVFLLIVGLYAVLIRTLARSVEFGVTAGTILDEATLDALSDESSPDGGSDDVSVAAENDDRPRDDAGSQPASSDDEDDGKPTATDPIATDPVQFDDDGGAVAGSGDGEPIEGSDGDPVGDAERESFEDAIAGGDFSAPLETEEADRIESEESTAESRASASFDPNDTGATANADRSSENPSSPGNDGSTSSDFEDDSEEFTGTFRFDDGKGASDPLASDSTDGDSDG